MAIGLGVSGVSKAYFRMFSSSGVVFPAPPGGQKQHRRQHSPHKIRHCKQHRKGKIRPQSSTITGTVTVPVVD
ncbi:hypothetical protein EHC23_25760 [Escherichia coli]|nr:hypothetical protein [Escherichia coli]EFN4171850.1 hypothetical protein [Escherichia coli]EFN7954008.1 hypothetical protein [Escherichia coli]EFO2462872.1 hypothetical protein [Escherichia coli]